MNKEIFEKEVAICKAQYQKQKGCSWGKCKDCGVVPLFYKLYKSKIMEDKEGIDSLRNNLFNEERNDKN